MMTKKKSKKAAGLGWLVCMPVLALTVCFCKSANDEVPTIAGDEVTSVGYGAKSDSAAAPAPAEPTYNVEDLVNLGELQKEGNEMPTFNGGDAGTFSLWVIEHLKYPDEMKTQRIEGRVITQFVITETGELADITILRSPDTLASEEVLRVVRNAPAWTPAKVGGKPVPTRFLFPVVFALE